MKTVYVVTSGEYIEAIFSSESNAEKYVDLHSSNFGSNYRITAWGVDGVNVNSIGYVYYTWGGYTGTDNIGMCAMRKPEFDKRCKKYYNEQSNKELIYPYVWLPEKDEQKALERLRDIYTHNKAVKDELT